MATSKNKRVIGFEADEGFVKELDDRAGREHRSRSQILARAARFYLDHAELAPVKDDPPRPKVVKR